MSNASTRKTGKTDWARLASMSDEEATANALRDPDNPPLTPKRLAALKRTPQIFVMRRALGLTQEEFSERYQIPLGTLRDWEQHRSEPDTTAKAYLRAIRGAPDLIAELVKQKPAA